MPGRQPKAKAAYVANSMGGGGRKFALGYASFHEPTVVAGDHPLGCRDGRWARVSMVRLGEASRVYYKASQTLLRMLCCLLVLWLYHLDVLRGDVAILALATLKLWTTIHNFYPPTLLAS